MVKKKEMLEFEYTRAALKNGLKLGKQLGTNPYKFGLVGSSDSHTGLAAMEEDNFFGKVSSAEPKPERIGATFMAVRAGPSALSQGVGRGSDTGHSVNMV